MISQLVKKFSALCGTRRFITVFAQVHHQSPILRQMYCGELVKNSKQASARYVHTVVGVCK
jgi:hypothetical protein